MGRVRVAAAALLGVGALAAGVLAGAGTGPFAPHPGALTLTPVEAPTLGAGGSHNVVVIMFPWEEDGVCSGQFSVSARESESAVVVSQVRGTERSKGELCAGLGTDVRVAGVELTLTAPLGSRVITWAVDGASVPVMDRCEQHGVPSWCPRPA